MKLATDWDSYYQSTPRYTSITRKISENKLIGLFKSYTKGSIKICELGGANSCFVDAICSRLSVASYHIVDLNEFGLSLLARKRPNTDLTWELGSVLDDAPNGERHDIVFSVGLIEHFEREATKQAVKHHFERCTKGGVVLITFPTPTAPYRAIRGAAERLGKWSFPDERPLHFDEVISAGQGYGELIHSSINWMIGLTQGYVVFRKKG